MKFRLDAPHYINDRLLEAGHIIGDETDVPMVLPNGEPLKPSVSMSPLDEEAVVVFKNTFPGSRLPERDPTKAIPLRGSGDTAKAPGLQQQVSALSTAPAAAPAAPAPAAPAPPAEKK